jgi:crossover junction endodeoxyribonuclease RuvC
MIILGVDPGTLVTGFGIIDVGNKRVSILECGVLKNPPVKSMPLRLKNIYDRLCELIKKYNPDEFAIETAFYGKNIQSTLKIGHARGVSILAAVNHEIPTSEYSPREVKKAVTGNGAASKQQVLFMIRKQLNMGITTRYFDVSDALAVALCHSYRLGSRKNRLRKSQIKKAGSRQTWSDFVKNHPERIMRRK